MSYYKKTRTNCKKRHPDYRIGGNVLSYFLLDTRMDFSVPEEYESAETLEGRVYISGKDLDQFQSVKKIKEMGNDVLIIMYDKVLQIDWELRIKKEHLASLRRFR